MRRKYARIRICKRGRTDRYPNQHIDGDMLSTNDTYKESINFIVNWKPDKSIKEFVDKHCPDYINKIKKDDFEIILYYPLSVEELLLYLESKSLLSISESIKNLL